jgi:hypothetical protein
VEPRAGLDDVEKRKLLNLLGLKLRPLCRPARSQSLYRLRYPSSPYFSRASKIYSVPCCIHIYVKKIEGKKIDEREIGIEQRN